MRDKATRQCPQTTTFEEKGEPKRIRTELALTPYLPLRQTGSQLPTSSLPYCVARRAASLRAASASHCHFFKVRVVRHSMQFVRWSLSSAKTWSRSKANSADCIQLQPFTAQFAPLPCRFCRSVAIVRACVRASMLYALNFDKYVFVENV